MIHLTYDDLMTILRECAGDSDEMPDDAIDVPFDDLGYDSLALMETAARLQREYGMALPDETIVDAATPRALLAIINVQLASSS